MVDFAKSCLRGIRQRSQINQRGFVSASVFHPDDRTNYGRDDNYNEVSIFWEVSENISNKIFAKEEKFLALVRLFTEDLESIKNNTKFRDCFNYEIQPEDSIDCHGNLLIDKDLDKITIDLLKNQLALYCDRPIFRE